MGEIVAQDINVVALVKGEERYIFLFDDNQKSQTLRTLGRYASDQKLSFSWYDAAVLSQKVRNIESCKSGSEVVRGLSQADNSLPNNKYSQPDSDWIQGEDLFSGEDMF